MSKKNAKVAAVETKPTRKTVATPIAPVTKKAAAEPKAKEATGRFLLFDQPVTAVLRALGKAGCTFEQVRPVLTKKKCDVADATIRIQLTAGKKGERGEPAKLSKVQIAEFKN